MSKDVRRLFAAQKAAKATSSPTSSTSNSLSTTSTKRVTHPLAKYDLNTLRLTCAICGPAVPIKSDSLWNAHLVSKPHQEAVAKLRAVKEQMQKKEAEAAERARVQQQQQQQQQQAQGVKRKAPSALVAYADDSDSESEEEETPASKQVTSTPESKRLKVDESTSGQDQMAAEIEEEEGTMAGLPAGFFDSPKDTNGNGNATEKVQDKEDDEDEGMSGVLPAGFFDDPEVDARIRSEVGGATTDHQQRQIDEEFKALTAELDRDLERQEQQEQTKRSGAPSTGTEAQTSSDYISYEEKVELEELELEESILARAEEEYQLFVEMQEKLDALREKKNRLLAHQSGTSIASSSIATSKLAKDSKPTKSKNKSMLDIVREQEKAKKEKERLAAEAFAKLRETADTNMSGDDDIESDDDDDEDEDIEAMMDWRAKRF